MQVGSWDEPPHAAGVVSVACDDAETITQARCLCEAGSCAPCATTGGWLGVRAYLGPWACEDGVLGQLAVSAGTNMRLAIYSCLFIAGYL